MSKAAYALGLCLLPTPVVAAGGDFPPLIEDIGYSLVLAGALAVVFNRLKIPSIAAFLLAGITAGPSGNDRKLDMNASYRNNRMGNPIRTVR